MLEITSRIESRLKNAGSADDIAEAVKAIEKLNHEGFSFLHKSNE
jgi:hypothetical protein